MKKVDGVVAAVGNRVYDAISTAMDKVVLLRVEMAVRSVSGSSARSISGWNQSLRPNSVVQNPDQRDFSGNMENNPVMTASSRKDSNINLDRKDKTGNSESFEEGEFTALKTKHARFSSHSSQSRWGAYFYWDHSLERDIHSHFGYLFVQNSFRTD